MAHDSELTILVQREVPYYDDTITAVQLSNGTIYVPVRPICELLGVDWSSQYRRIKRDPIMLESVQGIVIMTTPSTDGRGGGPQEMTCLPLDYLNGWLFGISADRVRPELRERVIRYQRDCYRILADAFQRNAVTAAPLDLAIDGDSPAAQAYRMALAIANIARQQLILESRLDATAGQVADHARRIETIETQISEAGTRTLTSAQASRISQAVKAIALALGERSGRNEFGGVYGELYRRFEIAGYRDLSRSRFDEALNFLSDWYRSLTDTDLPF